MDNITQYHMDRVEQMKVVQHKAALIFDEKKDEYYKNIQDNGFVCILHIIEYNLKNIMLITKRSVSFENDDFIYEILLDLHNYVAIELSNDTKTVLSVQHEGLELFKRKNADYGDAFAKYGIVGVLMRIEDKIQRILSITKNGVICVGDETLHDTYIDLHNYAAMALMLFDEK